MSREPVALYFWRLAAKPAEVAQLSACLSAEEVARADRFVRPEHGQAYRVGRGRMRHVLSEWLGCAPADVRFTLGPTGKPSLPDGPSFNLSHSGALACLAVHPDLTLGIDIEAPRPVEDGVARRFFSPAEFTSLSKLPPDLWQAGFYRCWTRKEAIVKATGIGMGARLDAFDVTLRPDQAPAVTRMETGDTQDWALAHLDVTGRKTRWIGALAVPDPGGPLTMDLRLRPDDLAIYWEL